MATTSLRFFGRLFEKKKPNIPPFALTDNGYEKLALNFADIRNKLAEQRQIILSYKEYYESDEANLDSKSDAKVILFLIIVAVIAMTYWVAVQ